MSDGSAPRQLSAARRALWLILGLSVLGIGFSGTLAYRELCLAGAGGCGVAQGGLLLGLPVCVYGLAMYILVGVTAAWGLRLGAPTTPPDRSLVESGRRPKPA